MITEARLDELIEDVLINKNVCGLKWLSCFNSVNIEKQVKGDRFAIVADFFTSSYKERAVYLGYLDKCEEDSIIQWGKDLAKEVSSIDKLNNLCSKLGNGDLSITYKWSQHDTSCSIDRWSANSVVVSLSRQVIDNLKCGAYDLKNVSNKDYRNAVEYILKFNDDAVNKNIGASLLFGDDLTSSIISHLESNMVTFRDILDNINSSYKGQYSFDSIISIKDLSIVGVYKISVDYATKVVDIILDRALIDVNSGDFIHNDELCNGIIAEMIRAVKNKLKWV